MSRLSRILAVEHVQVEARFEYWEDIRWFYGKVCCLDEVSPVTGDVPPRSLRFKSGRIELRIQFVEEAAVDGVRLRVTLAVPSLRNAFHLLEERGMAAEWQSGLWYTDRRVITIDPTGHRVALKQEWPEAPL